MYTDTLTYMKEIETSNAPRALETRYRVAVDCRVSSLRVGAVVFNGELTFV